MKFELKKYNINVSDQELLDDLRKVVKETGKQPLTRREYSSSGKNKFHGNTISRRFNGWNNALEKAGLQLSVQRNLLDEKLLNDLENVSSKIAPKKLTKQLYNEFGQYSAQIIIERFGWNNALKRMGLEISVHQNISNQELFKNIEEVWVRLGKQPGKRDIMPPQSMYSLGPYINRFGSWSKALEEFVEYINSDNKQIIAIENEELVINKDSLDQKFTNQNKHITKRDISDKLKVKVLIRDGNKCRLCGITVTGDNIHFDHIKPWSKGGETVFENIQVLCAPHNLAKGNYDGE